MFESMGQVLFTRWAEVLRDDRTQVSLSRHSLWVTHTLWDEPMEWEVQDAGPKE